MSFESITKEVQELVVRKETIVRNDVLAKVVPKLGDPSLLSLFCHLLST